MAKIHKAKVPERKYRKVKNFIRRKVHEADIPMPKKQATKNPAVILLVMIQQILRVGTLNGKKINIYLIQNIYKYI